jgi:DNA-binding GntR family transcriptional regulator
MTKKMSSREKTRSTLKLVLPPPRKRRGRAADRNAAAISPVVRNTLQDQAYNKLREALMSGLFRPGQSLTLRATAEVMGTSPMPVRDAVRRLEIEHALEPRPNRTLGVPEMTYASLLELRDVRVALEGLAAEKAAMLIEPGELAVVDTHYRDLAAAASVGAHGAYLQANWAFHSAIYRASRSQLLVSLIEPTWMRIGPYVGLMLPDRRSLIDSLGNHLLALRALQQRDSANARKAIGQDIWESAEGLARMLRDREEERFAKESGANEVPSSRRRSLSRSIAKQAQARD